MPPLNGTSAGVNALEERHNIGTIVADEFESLLQQYPSAVPVKLAELEKQRLDIIPQTLRDREMKFITRDELITLMEWKLYVPWTMYARAASFVDGDVDATSLNTFTDMETAITARGERNYRGSYSRTTL